MSPPHSSTTRRRPWWAAAAAGLLAVSVVAAQVPSSRASGDDSLTVSYDRESQVLDFRGPTFDGETVDSAELRGRPVVLNFYASWCTVCDRELPDVQSVSQRLGDRVRVLRVDPQSNDTDRRRPRRPSATA